MTTFITAPKVTLLSVPTFKEPEHLKVEWLGEATDIERLHEYSGRICYMSQKNPASRTTEIYLENIKIQLHGSVIEHGAIVFLLEGISRSCTHELVRHRAGTSFSQLSQRFVDESNVDFVVPPAMLDIEQPALDLWEDDMRNALRTYESLVSHLQHKLAAKAGGDKVKLRKMAREAARGVLPNSTETKIIMGANARAWRHIMEMRGSEHADLEIRRLAVEITKQLKNCAPSLFKDLELYPATDGLDAVKALYRKV